VKQIEYESEDIKAQMEKGEKYYSEGKIKEGIECFEQLSQLMVNIYGHS
jgi:hypothetical protein